MTAVGGTPHRRLDSALAVGRLGRRTLRAGGWRNVLVVALIALSITAAVAVAITVRSTDGERDHVRQRFGTVADVRIDEDTFRVTRFADLPPELQAIYVDSIGQPHAPPLPRPPVTQVIAEVLGEVPVLPVAESYTSTAMPGEAFPTGADTLRVLSVDLAAPLAAGLVRTTAPPPGEGEALLSRGVLRDLGARVGDEVTLPLVGQVTVTGEVSGSGSAYGRLAVVAADAIEPTTWLVDAPDDTAAERLAAVFTPDVGPEAVETSRFADTRARATAEVPLTNRADQILNAPSAIGTMVGALLLVQVGFVAAAAFATGTRRRIRTFGLLGAAGASPAHLRLVVLVEAGVLGLVAAAAGSALGLLAAILGRGGIERLTGATVDAILVSSLDLVGPAVVGVLAALLAALWPAITVARTTTATALAGRVPLRRVPAWLPVVAVLVTGTGLLVMALSAAALSYGGGEAWVVLAAALTGIGAAAMGVPLLGLVGRLADRLRARLRLVLRDTVRQRSRSGATVGALVVVLMIPTVILASLATDRERFGEGAPGLPSITIDGPTVDGFTLPPTDAMIAQVRDRLATPVTSVLEVPQIDGFGLGDTQQAGISVDVLDQVPGTTSYVPGSARLILATGEVLDALAVPTPARTFLAAGGVVDLAPPDSISQAQAAAGGRAAQLIRDGVDPVPLDLLPLEAPVPLLVDGILVSPETAEALDLPAPRRSVVLGLQRVLAEAEAQAVYALQDQIAGPSVLIEAYPVQERLPVEGIVMALALLVSLVIVAMATALAATESDRDLSVMTAVGADPGLRPAFHALQSAYHVALAAVIAIPTGLLLYRSALRDPFVGPGGLAVPVVPLLLVAVGIPLVVAGVMRLAMRPIRPDVTRRIA